MTTVPLLAGQAATPGPVYIVDLSTARDHLRLPLVLDATPRDPMQDDLEFKLLAAQEIIFNYIKVIPAEWVDSTTTPRLVQAAILLQLGELWRFRGDDLESESPKQTDGELSWTITNLVRRYRSPAYA